MAADWLKPRALPPDAAHVRESMGSPLPMRAAVLAFVVTFALGTAVPGLEAVSFLAGTASALVGTVLYVRAMRGRPAERRSQAVNDWLLYRPEPGSPAVEMAMFGLLGAGLAVTVVAAVVRIAVG